MRKVEVVYVVVVVDRVDDHRILPLKGELGCGLAELGRSLVERVELRLLEVWLLTWLRFEILLHSNDTF